MKIDPTPLSMVQKVFAGLILSIFISLSIIIITAYWPDEISKEKFWYTDQAFHITLIQACPCCEGDKADKAPPKEETKPPKKDATAGQQSTTPPDPKKPKDSKEANNSAGATPDTTKTDTNPKPAKADTNKATVAEIKDCSCEKGQIHLNTLILLLVGVGGFLGNMIYVGKSFTAFVGVGSFDRRWILWYCVKPFIASGLAVIVYLAFNNMPALETGTINLNRIVAVAALTGLFTDIAILKLKEIFEVIIKPGADKTISVKKMEIDITGIKPLKMDVNAENQFIIPGKNLQSGKVIVKIEKVSVPDIVVTATGIQFAYNIAEADRLKTTFQLDITDDQGNSLGSKVLPV